jgi:hypothetical protein
MPQGETHGGGGGNDHQLDGGHRPSSGPGRRGDAGRAFGLWPGLGAQACGRHDGHGIRQARNGSGAGTAISRLMTPTVRPPRRIGT